MEELYDEKNVRGFTVVKESEDDKSITETIYFHRDKEDNYGIKKKLDAAGICSSGALSIGDEVEMRIKTYIAENGNLAIKVLEINGVNVYDKDIFI